MATACPPGLIGSHVVGINSVMPTDESVIPNRVQGQHTICRWRHKERRRQGIVGLDQQIAIGIFANLVTALGTRYQFHVIVGVRLGLKAAGDNREIAVGVTTEKEIATRGAERPINTGRRLGTRSLVLDILPQVDNWHPVVPRP